MERNRPVLCPPPWGSLPTELVQDICSFLPSTDLASASLTCHAWRTAACGLVTHITLPLNHPLLLAGPASGWEETVARAFGQQQQQRADLLPASGGPDHDADYGGGSGVETVTPQSPGRAVTGAEQFNGLSGSNGPDSGGGGGDGGGGSVDCRAMVVATPMPPPPAQTTWSGRTLRGACVQLPRLRTDFPYVTHITLVHNSLLHRAQVHAALSTLRVLWPAVRGLSVHDSVTWDLPLDYSALGVMTHITSLELLFQGQGGMDEAGQPMYRASMPHLCRLSRLKELCMKWIIGYDVDSFLDFNEVYDLLASLVAHSQLRSLQFGGENINAEGAKHLASITTLETLSLVCDARPASPLHLLDLLTMPRLTRLELMHVCPDHAWNLEPLPGDPDPLVELGRRAAALTCSPLRCLALSLSPRCQALISRALPLLPHLHSLAVRVTSGDEEEALCTAFRTMAHSGPATPPSPPPPQQPQPQLQVPDGQDVDPAVPQPATPVAALRVAAATAAATPPSVAPGMPPPPPPLRSLRLETAELGAELISAVAHLTALTSLQLPRGLPTGDTVEYGPSALAAEAAGAEPQEPEAKYSMAHLSSLGRLANLRRLMVQLDSPADTPPAFIDGSLASILTGLAGLESLHLSTWNLVNRDPSAEALGAFPEHPTRQLQCLGDRAGADPGPGRGPASAEDGSACRGHDRGPQAAAGGPTTSRPRVLLNPAELQELHGVFKALEEARQLLKQQQQQQQHRPPSSAAPGEAAHEAGPSGRGSGDTASGSLEERVEVGPSAAAARDRRLGQLVAGAAAAPAPAAPCLAPLPTWAWRGLRSLSLTHWPCVYGKLREAGPPQPGRCYAVRLEDLPSSLEALLLVRCQLSGYRPPPGLRHLWLADCISPDCPLPQLLTAMASLETLVLRWPSSGQEEEPVAPESAARQQRMQLVAAVASLRGLRTLGLGGIRCHDVPSLGPLSLLRHLMLEPLQPPRPVGEAPSAQRDLTLLDHLMALPPGAMAGLRTMWLPNWAMPIKQLLQWQQMLQAAMPLVVLRVIEYDVVWTVPTPVMHVARVEAPSSLRGENGVGPAAAAAPTRGGGGSGPEGSGAGGGPQQRDPSGLGGGGGGSGRRHAGCGLDGQELEWWHIGCWTVQ